MSRRKTTAHCHQLAAAKGGRCLSTEYKNNATKYLWECKEGHRWEAMVKTIQKGHWCPYCAGCAPKNLQWLQELAVLKEGKCLSTEYKNNHTKYLWECKEGHRWEATANDIQQKQWCPYCAKHAPHNLQWLQELASSNEGRCLALKYKGVMAKYLWECSEGHRWEAKAFNLQQGHWCPYCAGKVSHNLQWLCDLATQRSGRCLSTEYKNNATKYLWECKEGHRWEAVAKTIQRGCWCPHCAGHLPKTLQWLHDLAALKKGKCLSTEYKNAHAKYLWECSKGHQWGATASNIRSGWWCPVCSRKTSQIELQLLEFVKQSYPDAQKGTGCLKRKRLELDIYIPSLRKAIEFDGEFWHYSDWAIQKGQPQRDQRKNQQCSDAGIQLLRVREREYLTNPQKTQQQILEFLK